MDSAISEQCERYVNENSGMKWPAVCESLGGYVFEMDMKGLAF